MKISLVAALALLALPITMARAADQASDDDTARYLAGLAPSSGSPLAPLTKERGWARHASVMDKAWARIEKDQITPIRAWSKKYIETSQKFMLYTFSGPDFLYANAFFPNAETYVLSALEPVGPKPDLTSMSRAARLGGIQNLRSSMQTVLSYSFFITKQMKSQLRGSRLQGTLPVLYVFLARAGKTIKDVELVSLNDDGTVTAREDKAPKGSARGAKITFTDDTGKDRTLYYFSTDISNGGLKKSGFLKFCETLGPADSLIKSASYLPHSGNFSTIRDFILENSQALVQDDSGVPIKYFDRKKWDLLPFGRYLGPISLFPNRYQRDARALFAKPVAKKIDFGIGYRWRTHETNVLLAKRSKSAANNN